MCKASSVCSELGSDVRGWSRLAPLIAPPWFHDEFEKFRIAVQLAAADEFEESLHQLQQVQSDDLRSWYVVHGQNSGTYRARHFRISAKIAGTGMRGAPPVSMLNATYRRDHYRCRYCGLRLFPIEVLRSYENAIGTGHFAASAKNASHGVALVFRATYDHVDPLNCGGRHCLDNLVTACYSCNFGKAGYTLEQLGLDDPRSRPIAPDDWDGLVSLMPRLVGKSL